MPGRLGFDLTRQRRGEEVGEVGLCCGQGAGWPEAFSLLRSGGGASSGWRWTGFPLPFSRRRGRLGGGGLIGHEGVGVSVDDPCATSAYEKSERRKADSRIAKAVTHRPARQ